MVSNNFAAPQQPFGKPEHLRRATILTKKNLTKLT